MPIETWSRQQYDKYKLEYEMQRFVGIYNEIAWKW